MKSPIVQYLTGVTKCLKTKTLLDDFTNCRFEDGDDAGMVYICNTDVNLAILYPNTDSLIIECLYPRVHYTDSIKYTITSDNIKIDIDTDEVDKTIDNVAKGDYFNIIVSMNMNMDILVDFDDIIYLQNNIQEYNGVKLLYVKGEEKEYGYI